MHLIIPNRFFLFEAIAFCQVKRRLENLTCPRNEGKPDLSSEMRATDANYSGGYAILVVLGQAYNEDGPDGFLLKKQVSCTFVHKF